jgi:hypothetical protein
MASTDALPVPRKNVAYRITFPILDADGDLVPGATGLDSEISKDAGTFADCTNEATEIATSSGMYYLDLTSTEMNADCVALIIKTSSSGAKTTPIVLYPQEADDIRVNTTYVGGTSQTGRDIGASVLLSSGTGTGQLDFTSGVVKSNATQWLGGTIPAVNVTGVPKVDLVDWLGTAPLALTSQQVQGVVPSSTVVASVTGAVGSVTGAVGSVTAGVTLAASAVQAIWDAARSALTTVGSIGEWLVQNLNTTVSSRASSTAVDDLPTNAELATALGTSDDATLAAIAALNNLSAAQVRTELTTELGRIDVAVSSRLASASYTAAPTAAQNRAEMDSNSVGLAAIYARTDVATSTRATPAQVNAECDTALADVGLTTTVTGRIDVAVSSRGTGIALDAAGVRSAVGLASANLDTQLATIVADTNELQTDWANGGRLDLILDARASQASVDTIQTSVDTVDGIVDAILIDTAEIGTAGAGLTALATAANLATLTTYVDTEVASIKTVTDHLATAMELDGSVYRFTTNALEQGPSGSASINVTPFSGRLVNQTIRSSGITEIFQWGPLPYGPMTVTDANDDPVDLSGETVILTIASQATTGPTVGKVYQLTSAGSGNLTITGAGNNDVIIEDADTPYTDEPGDWTWNLRVSTLQNKVVLWGVFRILPMAVEASP